MGHGAEQESSRPALFWGASYSDGGGSEIAPSDKPLQPAIK